MSHNDPVERVFRAEHGRVLAILIGLLGDFDLAEDALSDTLLTALERWPRDGRRLTTDGPFAETKEHLGGFYLVDAADLDEAIEFAAAIPDARRGSIEIRPVVDFG